MKDETVYVGKDASDIEILVKLEHLDASILDGSMVKNKSFTDIVVEEIEEGCGFVVASQRKITPGRNEEHHSHQKRDVAICTSYPKVYSQYIYVTIVRKHSQTKTT